MFMKYFCFCKYLIRITLYVSVLRFTNKEAAQFSE
jgi:hypothetical protein